MVNPSTPREKLGYLLLCGLAIAVFGFVGARYLRRTPDIRVEGPMSARSAEQAIAGSEPAPVPTEVVVHVVGAVKSPGILRLPPGSRVIDAISRAGGAAPTADLDELNLAAMLTDGTQLYVPKKQTGASPPQRSVATERVSAQYRGGASSVPTYSAAPTPLLSSGGSRSGELAKGSININTAGRSELERLPGVGPATADKILAYRKQHGGFTSVDELLNVRGIGPKKLSDMRPFVRL